VRNPFKFRRQSRNQHEQNQPQYLLQPPALPASLYQHHNNYIATTSSVGNPSWVFGKAITRGPIWDWWVDEKEEGA
jgi:hypothetical protein